MISREICQRVLHKALSTGADYAEIFAENTVNHSINMIANHVDGVKDTVVAGASVRLFKPRIVICVPSGITEVEERAGKLCAFFKSPIFEKLSDKKKELMHEQYDAMILYSTKVGQRLELEKKGE